MRILIVMVFFKNVLTFSKQEKLEKSKGIKISFQTVHNVLFYFLRTVRLSFLAVQKCSQYLNVWIDAAEYLPLPMSAHRDLESTAINDGVKKHKRIRNVHQYSLFLHYVLWKYNNIFLFLYSTVCRFYQKIQWQSCR